MHQVLEQQIDGDLPGDATKGSNEKRSISSSRFIVYCGRDVGALAEGVKPGVSLAAGAFCEFSLAFVLNLAILYSMSKLPTSHSAVQSMH